MLCLDPFTKHSLNSDSDICQNGYVKYKSGQMGTETHVLAKSQRGCVTLDVSCCTIKRLAYCCKNMDIRDTTLTYVICRDMFKGS